jgi:hypothetical protein
MPAGSVAGKVEGHLAASAAKKHLTGRRKARYIYGAMNNKGLMHGNQVTAKGMERASIASMAQRRARPR